MKILDFIKNCFPKKDPDNTGCPFDQEWEFEVSTENNTKIQKCKVCALDPIGGCDLHCSSPCWVSKKMRPPNKKELMKYSEYIKKQKEDD